MSVDARIERAFLRDNSLPLEPHLVVLALMGSHSHDVVIYSLEKAVRLLLLDIGG